MHVLVQHQGGTFPLLVKVYAYLSVKFGPALRQNNITISMVLIFTTVEPTAAETFCGRMERWHEQFTSFKSANIISQLVVLNKLESDTVDSNWFCSSQHSLARCKATWNWNSVLPMAGGNLLWHRVLCATCCNQWFPMVETDGNPFCGMLWTHLYLSAEGCRTKVWHAKQARWTNEIVAAAGAPQVDLA